MLNNANIFKNIRGHFDELKNIKDTGINIKKN